MLQILKGTYFVQHIFNFSSLVHLYLLRSFSHVNVYKKICVSKLSNKLKFLQKFNYIFDI